MDYLRPGGQLVMREGTHNVKKRAECFTFFCSWLRKPCLRDDDKFRNVC